MKRQCNKCKHNPMGYCELCGREITYHNILHNDAPTWCPLLKGGKNGKGKRISKK
jgi:hypothetical protein